MRLEQLFTDRRLESVEEEFKRANKNLQSDPRAAITAASSILEAIFRVILKEKAVDLPKKQTITDLWKCVRKNVPSLSSNPKASSLPYDDVQKLQGGLATVVQSIGALRTHAGSAHGRDSDGFHVETRHAQLAVDAAFATVQFLYYESLSLPASTH